MSIFFRRRVRIGDEVGLKDLEHIDSCRRLGVSNRARRDVRHGVKAFPGTRENIMHQPETRPTLILRLKGERNETAWNEFVSTYELFLRQLVGRQGVAERDLNDVTQQLLAAIARSVEGWRDDGSPASFRRWLHRVARNVVIKFLARERRQVGGRGGTDFLDMLQQVPEQPNEAQLRAYEHELVLWSAHQVQAEFHETSWRAFWETLVAGRAVGDVARELGVTPGSIYMSRSRIMARIRTKIREVDDE